MRAALLAILFCAAVLRVCAQDAPPPIVDPAPQTPQNLHRTLATLHGIVRNAATGEGLPRALVHIEGDMETGALTDGDGRFEIDSVPVGPQAVDVSRPGFFNPAFSGNAEAPPDVSGPPHNVLVAPSMADVVFTLAPAGAIRGRIDLSTGDPAEGIEVALVRRVISAGRSAWQPSGFSKTRSDGTYRFGSLADGQYALYTMPALDGDTFPALVASGKAADAQRWGYASIYYPDTRDPSGATVISIANGSEAQANFTLTREPFYAVSITFPQSGPAHEQAQYTAEITDGAGHILPYPAVYDSNAHSFQATLPDGAYAMLLAVIPHPPQRFNGNWIGAGAFNGMLSGQADIAVAGHAIPNLRAALAPVALSPIQVTIVRSGTPSAPSGQQHIHVMVSPAGSHSGATVQAVFGSPGGEVMGQYAEGAAEGPLESAYMDPGQYWVHTFISGGGLCESSFTAGGASLGREPLAIGLSGQTEPLGLTLRDDCARLSLALPESLMQIGAGEEKFYTVYAVPDFDFTWDVDPVILRASTGGTFTLDNLTPGSYHVYTLTGNANFEYRNPAALAALPNPGQPVTLAPGATANLVLEAPTQ